MITLSEFQLSTFHWNFYFDFSEPPQPTQNCTRANGFFPFPANESCQKFWDCRGGKKHSIWFGRKLLNIFCFSRKLLSIICLRQKLVNHYFQLKVMGFCTGGKIQFISVES